MQADYRGGWIASRRPARSPTNGPRRVSTCSICSTSGQTSDGDHAAIRVWSRREDSNLHGLLQRVLGPPRLPFRHFEMWGDDAELLAPVSFCQQSDGRERPGPYTAVARATLPRPFRPRRNTRRPLRVDQPVALCHHSDRGGTSPTSTPSYGREDSGPTRVGQAHLNHTPPGYACQVIGGHRPPRSDGCRYP